MEFQMLNNGVQMPMEGYGVFQITDAAQCEQYVSDALSLGYRLIDTASAYGNEEAVGRAIRSSGVARVELFITTKLWVQDTGYENTRKAFDVSLEKLGPDYLDLYLIHQPFGDYYGSWRAMEELHREGKIRTIGVCNFLPERLVDLCMNHEIAPAVNQIEIHPFFQQDEAIQVMKEFQVMPQAWGPLSEGQKDIFHNKTLETIAGMDIGHSEIIDHRCWCTAKQLNRFKIHEQGQKNRVLFWDDTAVFILSDGVRLGAQAMIYIPFAMIDAVFLEYSDTVILPEKVGTLYTFRDEHLEVIIMTTSMEEIKKERPFPIGEENTMFAEYFRKKSYAAILSTEPVGIVNVTFEPDCRNNWPIHHGAGQILLCTAGEGFYQEWGKDPIPLKPGDVVNIPAEVKHWHGAAPGSWFSHVAIAVPGEGASCEWLESATG